MGRLRGSQNQGRQQSAAGNAAPEFAFEGLGKLGSLSHFSAVAEIMGVRISGLPAWFLWASIYLMKMPNFASKVRIGLDWLVAPLFPPDLVQLRTAHESDIERQHFELGEAIFDQGDFGDNVYAIEKGSCEVPRERNGDKEHVSDLGGGDYFGARTRKVTRRTGEDRHKMLSNVAICVQSVVKS